MSSRRALPSLGSYGSWFFDEGVQSVLENWAPKISTVRLLKAFATFSAFAFIDKRHKDVRWFKRAGARFLIEYTRHQQFSAELLLAIERARTRRVGRTVKEMGIHFSNTTHSSFHRAHGIPPGLLSYDQLAYVLRSGLESKATAGNLKTVLHRETRRRNGISQRWEKRLAQDWRRHKKRGKV